MIHLITGVPGSGKSLLAVELILKNYQDANIRPCYSNIDGLDYTGLRCFPLDDVEYWYDLPDGSIIVIDECQRWFRPRPNGSVVPEYISRFETHRHQGHDIVLVTQHPGLIDRNIRKLVELHQHMYRPFGMERRTVFEWNTCNESPEPAQTESTANKVKKPFDKELFKYYKSATVHTHKKRLPWRKFALAAGAMLFAVGAFASVVVPKISAAMSDTEIAEPAESIVSDAAPIDSSDYAGSKSQLAPLAGIMFYRGHHYVGSELHLFLEDAESGEYFDLPDFTGYRKEGVDVVFYIANESSEYAYRVRNRDLLKLLP